jgi:hypothetical protein
MVPPAHKIASDDAALVSSRDPHPQLCAEDRSRAVPTFTPTVAAVDRPPPPPGEVTSTPATTRVPSRLKRRSGWFEKSGVGAFVGNAVGAFVGAAVGAGVGVFEGGLLGAAVGDSDAQSHELLVHAHVKSPSPQSESR